MKVGDYVRTSFGCICKIVNINEFREPSMKYGVEASYLKDIMFIGDDDIKLVKEKPIDLVQVGDYVNGHRVQEISESYVEIEEYSGLNNDIPCIVKADDIKSIVTKEQFEAIQYKVGE